MLRAGLYNLAHTQAVLLTSLHRLRYLKSASNLLALHLLPQVQPGPSSPSPVSPPLSLLLFLSLTTGSAYPNSSPSLSVSPPISLSLSSSLTLSLFFSHHRFSLPPSLSLSLSLSFSFSLSLSPPSLSPPPLSLSHFFQIKQMQES